MEHHSSDHIRNMILDLVKDNIEVSDTNKERYQGIKNLLSECLKQFPNSFVCDLSTTESDCEFLVWLFPTFLNVVTKPHCSHIAGDIVLWLVQILKLLQLKSRLFPVFLKEIIHLFKDVSFLSFVDGPTSIEPFLLTHFVGVGEHFIKCHGKKENEETRSVVIPEPPLICLTSSKEVTDLLNFTVRMVLEFTEEISQLFVVDAHIVWDQIFTLILHSKKLRLTSFQLINQQIHQETQIGPYLTKKLCNTLILLLKEIDAQYSCDEHFVECLFNVFGESHNMILSPLLYLEQLSVVLWDILKSGLYHKYPVYFQKCLGHLLYQCWLAQVLSTSCLQYFLYEAVGSTDHLKPFVPVASAVLVYEMTHVKALTTDNLGNTGKRPDNKVRKKTSQQKLFHQLFNKKRFQKWSTLTPFTTTVAHMFKSCGMMLSTLCSSNENDAHKKIIHQMEGISFLVEVVCTSLQTKLTRQSKWLVPDILDECLGWLECLLQWMSSKCVFTSQFKTKVLKLVLHCVVLMVSLQGDEEQFSQHRLNQYLWVLSLPWKKVNLCYSDDAFIQSSLSLEERKRVKCCLSTIVDNEDLNISLKGLAIVTVSSWNDAKSIILTAAMGSVSAVKSNAITYLPMLVVTMEMANAVNIVENILNNIQWNDEMMLELTKNIFALSLIMSGEKRLITIKMSNPLDPSYVVDLSKTSLLNKPVVSEHFCRLLSHVIEGSTNPFVLTACIEYTGKVVAFIGPDSIHLLLRLLNHPHTEVATYLCNHADILSQYWMQIGNEISKHPLFVKVKGLVVSGKSRNCELAAKILGCVGRRAEGHTVYHCITLLLELIFRGNVIVRTAAYVQIKTIIKAQRISPKLSSSLKKAILELLIDVLNENPTAIIDVEESSFCSEVAVVFGYENLSGFLHDTVDVFVSLLVANGSENAYKCIQFIAQKFKKTTRELLFHNLKHIFSHLMLYCSESRRKASFQFLKNAIKLQLEAIIRSHPISILNHLLLYLSPHPLQVAAGVSLLAEVEDSVSITTDEDLAQFLYPKLLAILKFFDAMLVRSSHHGDLEAGELAISSLTKLIKLMGPSYITPCRVNVMALLRSSQKFKDEKLCRLTCHAWRCFVESVDLSSLGPLLSQIVVALYPWVNKFPDIITTIFTYLIIEHKEKMSPFFNEVYIMPEEPVLAEVNDVLKQSMLTPSVTQESVIHQQLKHALKGISHERADVKLHATRALQLCLHGNKEKVQNIIVGNEVVDPVVTDFVSAIVNNLKESDAVLRLKCGECLGLLGAIDPGRLRLPVFAIKKKPVIFQVDGPSGDFALEFINELTKAFLAAADAQVQNCCAFAIQEMLLVYDCANLDPSSPGAIVWMKVPVNTRELLAPYLHSTYSPRYPNTKKIGIPMFNPSSNLSFKDWIQKWTSHLIAKLQDSHVKKLFLPCTLIFKHNINPALFLLPHLLLYVLCQESDSTSMIHTEIIAVLKCAAENNRHVLDTSITMCAQTIFTSLDHLQAWLHNYTPVPVKGKASKSTSQAQVSNNRIKIESFMDNISKELLARAAYSCRAYARALKYLEQYLFSNPLEVPKKLGFLQEVYVSLNDVDGVTGVAAIRQVEPSIREQILQFESTGNFRDAAACYENAVQKNPQVPKYQEGLLQCMMNLGEFTSVLLHVNGLIAERPDWTPLFNSYRVEAAWRLGDWKCLEQTQNEGLSMTHSWGAGLGKVLIAAKKKDISLFYEHLLSVRNSLMGPLTAASLEQGSYQRGYDYIVKLHMLEEVEEFVREVVFEKDDIGVKLDRILLNWKNRLTATQESFKTQESILNLHRILLSLLVERSDTLQRYLSAEIGQLWLNSAKVARQANYLQTAHNLLLHASDSEYVLPELCLEKAEWIRCRHDSHQAMLSLQKVIDERWSKESLDADSVPSSTIVGTTTHAKAVLMIGKWMEDTEHESQTILKKYKAAVHLDPESEESHFRLGNYYDRLLTLVQEKPQHYSEVLQFTIQHYGNALQYGNRFIYHCMPRALSLWLDYGSGLHDPTITQDQISKMNKLMNSLIEKLPPYQYLVVFSQIISRVCHPNTEVFATLKDIILKLLQHYPQQCLWMMIAVSKSTLKPRAYRCKDILDTAKRNYTDLVKLIKDLNHLSDNLLDVCSYYCGTQARSTTTSMDKICRELVRLTTHKDFSPIIVPLQSSLTVTLPTSHHQHTDHNPFPGIQPTIIRFDDKVEILQSMQKPKKIIILGSDGKAYSMMCKPKDDLRKDCRLMEFNSVINKFLLRDPECRQRHLYIRTYAVVPLNEESGIVEWVENTSGLRNILYKLYRERGCYTSGNEVKNLVEPAVGNRQLMKEVFETKLILKHPPILGKWFMKMFPDPTAWYSSQQAYSRTTAVMSMVGYIVGLGDRHGENILLDSTTGDCVHVDFSCLFNKGETFEYPEIVPFRLTHNMVNAMGVTGCEGTFRTCCEITMKVLREQKDPLMCVLKTLIHDPLVEWISGSSRSSKSNAEPTNKMAVKIVNNIEQRLKGQTGKTLPLSVKGQVHALIKEATDINNLSQMYIGWGPYL